MSRPNIIPDIDRLTGAACREARLRFGITIQAVVSTAGVDRRDFTLWEKGRRPNPWHGAGAVWDALMQLAIAGCDTIAARLEERLTAHRKITGGGPRVARKRGRPYVAR